MAKLTAKQERFVEEYLVDLNATQAAIRAGYSQKTADRIGPELLGKTCVSDAIQKARQRREQRTAITQDRVLKELEKVGFASAADYTDATLKYSNKLKALELLGNVYSRFLETAEEIRKIEKEYVAQVETETMPQEMDEAGFAVGSRIVGAMSEFDRRVKERLSYVFGQENDFDRILGGVNLMAVATNGERIVTNFLNALLPVIEEGIAKHDMDKASQAAQEAAKRRAIRTT